MSSKLATRIDGMGKRMTDMIPSMQGGFLTNKWMLYLVLFSAVFDVFYFYQKDDVYAVTIFFIIGFLASFFSKNMVVILIIAIVFTHLIRYGKNLSEGFEEEEEEKEGFEGEELEEEGFEDEEEEKEGFEGEELEEEGFEEDELEEGFEGEPDLEEESFEGNTTSAALIQSNTELIEKMKTLEPMLEKAEGFLQSVGKKETFASLADAYKPLM